jgi:acyl-CoA synthetase (AMP-forming)/AMP-acid ligase II
MNGPALVVVEEDGTSVERSFDEMACARTGSRPGSPSRGSSRGDAVIVMLGNQVELWESMLAVMKLGAVIMPPPPPSDRPTSPTGSPRGAPVRRSATRVDAASSTLVAGDSPC